MMRIFLVLYIIVATVVLTITFTTWGTLMANKSTIIASCNNFIRNNPPAFSNYGEDYSCDRVFQKLGVAGGLIVFIGNTLQVKKGKKQCIQKWGSRTTYIKGISTDIDLLHFRGASVHKATCKWYRTTTILCQPTAILSTPSSASTTATSSNSAYRYKNRTSTNLLLKVMMSISSHINIWHDTSLSITMWSWGGWRWFQRLNCRQPRSDNKNCSQNITSSLSSSNLNF